MVQRPPIRGASNGSGDDYSDSVRSATSGGPRRGLEWSLRSLHKIDTSEQHFLKSYYADDEDETQQELEETLEDQTAFEIFKQKEPSKYEAHNGNGSSSATGDAVWASMNAPLRTGIVDGKKVVFELRKNVTEKPATSRKERLKRSHIVVNAEKSSREVRVRLWMMHFGLEALSVAFLAVFIAMNAVFAVIFYFSDPNHCCGDPSLRFEEVFAFCVQTSTTIGYGGWSPEGHLNHFLVVILSYMSTLINTLFAGLLFTKFVTPVINIQFSDVSAFCADSDCSHDMFNDSLKVLTLCNVNGVPCLSFRLGNADGQLNPLTDINVSLTYSFQIPYIDDKGDKNFFRQTEELKLLSNRQHGLKEVWTLRHVIDESSPLFGLHFEEHPGNKIYLFTLSVDAVQELTKSTVNVQTGYSLEDILIGHTFQNQVTFDDDERVFTSDYSKMSATEPCPVWYPARAGAFGIDKQRFD